MRAVPVRQPRRTNIEPNARALAHPEQNTNISAADEKPNRAGMYSVQLFSGTCATKMISIASPRKKSSRRSRERAAANWSALQRDRSERGLILSRFELHGEKRRRHECERDSEDASRPAEAIEDLRQDGAADEPSAEVEGEIKAAGCAAIDRRGVAHKACCDSLGEEGPDADKRQACGDGRQTWRNQQRQPDHSHDQRSPNRPSDSEAP